MLYINKPVAGAPIAFLSSAVIRGTKKPCVVDVISTTEEPLAEKKVEQMAEHSIKEREIITVAMAEVWEKQGNKAKAIDIYSKLSLLEPSKSPYIAAKIEELKKTN